jgi:hypothetical protein
VETPEQNSPAGPNTASESFGDARNASEPFRKFGASQTRKETHTISVRDAAKMFEAAGVPRTERSIINWCWPNRQGMVRLDSYFDPNDRKHLITHASIDLAIKEELSKGQGQTPAGTPKPEEHIPNASEAPAARSKPGSDGSPENVDELRKQVVDLNITNRAKDMYIERLHKEREDAVTERHGYITQLIEANHQIGQLETRLRQLEAPKEQHPPSPQSVPSAEPAVG